MDKRYNKSVKKKLLKVISLSLVVFILFFLTTTLAEYVVINNEIESFMERGKLVDIDIINKIKYYEVPRKEGEVDKPSFTSYYGDKYAFAGSYGDVLLTQESPFFGDFDIPLAYEFVSLWFGGHAAIISDEFDEDGYPEIIEATALSKTPENNVVTKTWNYWLYQEYRDNFIGIRVKGATTNDYKNLDLKITKKDMYPELQKNTYGVRDKDRELASILNNYETLREHLRSEMAKIKTGEGSYLTLYQIKSMLSTIIGDMHDSKKMVLGIRNQAKRLGDESPYTDYTTLDYSNPEHVKHCLKFCRITKTPRPDDMVSHIGYDLHKAINKLSKRKKIDNIDKEIIECYNSGNYSLDEIGKELNISKVAVFKRINKISKKISEVI